MHPQDGGELAVPLLGNPSDHEADQRDEIRSAVQEEAGPQQGDLEQGLATTAGSDAEAEADDARSDSAEDAAAYQVGQGWPYKCLQHVMHAAASVRICWQHNNSLAMFWTRQHHEHTIPAVISC